jgi:hypothetical protein
MNPMNDILNGIAGVIVSSLAAQGEQLAPLLNMLLATPPALTTQNAAVLLAWRVLLILSDGMLGLVVVIEAIQIMQSNSMRIPLGQFVGRVLLSALLMHSSAFLLEQLVQMNNLLCGLLSLSTRTFLMELNAGRSPTSGQQLLLAAVVTIVFAIGLFRWILQAITRLARLDMLFVLSGPAFLCLVHPATAPVFSAWIRLYIATIFEQFIQLLAFGLGIQLIASAHQTGLAGFVVAAAMLNFTASVPRLLERFGASGTGPGSVSTLMNLAFRAVVLLA